jgi:hypothetical protein
MLGFQISCNVLWAKGLAKQINLMSNGANVTTTPLPLKNPKSMFVGSSCAIIIKACPICSSFYVCNNIMVLSCGYTYHQFCVGLHFESKATHYVNRTCGKPIFNDWIVSYGFQQKSLLLKRPKQEKGCNIVSTTRSIQGSISPNITFPYNFFCFI